MLIHCHSYFSMRYGILAPKDLVEWAATQFSEWKEQTVSLCLADINSVSGLSDFFRESKKYKHLHPCAGVDCRNRAKQQFLLIARSEKGFTGINRFLSYHLMQEVDFDSTPWQSAYWQDNNADERKMFEQEVTVVYPLEVVLNGSVSTEKLKEYEYIGVKPFQLIKMRQLPAAIKRRSRKFLALATATFRQKTDFNTHRLLRSIDNNCLLSKLPVTECGHPEDLYRTLEELLLIYKDTPLLLENTERVLQQCQFAFDFGGNKNKKRFTQDTEEDFRMMTELAYEGMRYRYPRYNYAIKMRLEKELQLIYELGFTAYFLINWDICRFAREQGFYYVGRGSGANSMVAYCLRITDVDPIDLDLYFERFINPYRSSPPDFDLDFSWQDRDTVTAYILNKYTYNHAALLATYSTFQANAVIRELGKVFGLPKAEIDALLSKNSYYSANEIEKSTGQRIHPEKKMPAEAEVYSNPGIMVRNSMQKVQDEAQLMGQGRNELFQKMLLYAHRIHDLPNHLSIHVGGVLIAEKPIFSYSATTLPPKGFPTVQFSMLEAEDLGLAKFDILSQRGLGHIKDAIHLIRQNQNVEIDIHQIQAFKTDEKIQRLIATGHTMGCFYVESPAMRQLLRKLKCNDYLTLVAASSVIRPGVARSGMMREYILRHVDVGARARAHPVLQEIMPETYGIMVYQEDVIKVAHHFAGLGLAESDVLRRGMSGKFRSRQEFLRVKERFFELCKEKGHSDKLTQEVWFQIESFAGYSFAKGHSASYAVESYQSLYLKAHFPLEFYVAVINNFGGFYKTEFYIHAARMCGATIEAPCIQNSLYLTKIQEKTVYLGWVHVDSLEKKLADKIVLQRIENGVFEHLADFVERVQPGIEQLKLLIRINAFRELGKNKKELMWEAHWLLNKTKPQPQVQKLFVQAPKAFQLPTLEIHELEDAFEQIELLGFPLSNPFLLADETALELKQGRKWLRGSTLKVGSTIVIEGYLVTVKPTKTIKGQEMNFGTWIDYYGHFFDTIHFPPSLRYGPFKGRGLYLIQGTVGQEFGVISIEVQCMKKIPYKQDPRFT